MNSSIGILAALATVACWTVGTFSFTRASREAEPLRVNRVRLLYAFLVLTLVCWIGFGLTPWMLFTTPDLTQWFWLGISGIVGLTIGDYFAFNAFRLIGSSKASMFNTVAPVAALLLGIVLLDEHLNTAGLLGMAISIGGILWFVKMQDHGQGHTKNLTRQELLKGFLFAALGAIGQGLGLVCAKKGLIHSGTAELHAIHATWIRMGIGASITYVVGVFRTDLIGELKEITTQRKTFVPIIIGTVFGPVIGVTMSLLAAKNLEVSLAQTILSLLPISVLFTAQFTGKEKVTPASFIAALISISGVVVLVWRNELSALIP